MKKQCAVKSNSNTMAALLTDQCDRHKIMNTYEIGVRLCDHGKVLTTRMTITYYMDHAALHYCHSCSHYNGDYPEVPK